MIKKVVFPALTVFLSLFIFFALAELILRVKGDTYSWSEQNGRGYLSPYETEKTNCLHVRNTGSLKYNSPDFNYGLDVNNEGIRDSNHSVINNQGRLRVIGLGDSFTEGMGAPFDSTWLNQLSSFSLNGRLIEPISGGVAGADMFTAFHLFNDRLLKYNPDFLIVVINQTDVNDFFVRGGFERFEGTECHTKEAPMLELFFKNSHLIRSFLINVLGYNWQLISESEREMLWIDFISEYKSLIDSYMNLSTDGGFKLIIAFHPLVHEVQLGQYEFPFYELQQYRNDEVEYIDILNRVLSETQNGSDVFKLYWPNDQHFNSLGYQVFAEEIYSSSTLSTISE